MFNLFDLSEDVKFDFDSIGDITTGRRNLGEEMPVLVYRLFQFTIRKELISKFGRDACVEIFRNAGRKAGQEYADNLLDLTLPPAEFLSILKKTLEYNKIGLLHIEKFDIETGDAVLAITEDLDCSGVPVTGETICNYDEGFLAGILKAYTKKNYIVTEVDCWANGADACRFEARIAIDY